MASNAAAFADGSGNGLTAGRLSAHSRARFRLSTRRLSRRAGSGRRFIFGRDAGHLDPAAPCRGCAACPMLTRLFVDTTGVRVAEVERRRADPGVGGKEIGRETLEPRKFAGIAVETDELLSCFHPPRPWRLSMIWQPRRKRKTMLPQRRFARLRVVRANRTHGAGCSFANVDCDLKLLIAAVRGASSPNATFIMSKGTASYLHTLRGSGGAAAFPELGRSGGPLLSLPVLISSACRR